jgi:glycosyltransferase involved in cell wall biosynthesis
VGEFHHIDEKLYQRRWHGENTSHVNEHHQTTNTHRVQREALKRQGLARTWDVHVPDPEKPRNVTYRLREGTKMVVFWPDYSRSNPYQKLLYAGLRQRAEVVAGDIDACLKLIDTRTAPASDITFHLHWLNALFRGIRRTADAEAVAEAFAAKLALLQARGARLVWTLHNTLSHDTPFAAIETALSARIAGMADAIHLHSAGSRAEVDPVFPVPADKLLISRHGHYIGVYPDHVPRGAARAALGIGAEEDVILFTGLVRPYKGVEALVQVFRRILAARPQARLVIAGQNWFDPLEGLVPALSTAERARILTSDRFIEPAEFQVFFRAADIAAYPYQRTLTSGSLMLALSFGVPTVVPQTAMTAGVLEGQDAGQLYAAEGGEAALEAALGALLAAKDAGRLPAMAGNARRVAEAMTWPAFGGLLG